MRRFPVLMTVVAALGLALPAAAAIPTPPTVDTALETVRAARKVMMNNPAEALAIGVDLERRASGTPDARVRSIVLAKANWIAGEASLRLNRIDDARRLINTSYALATASGDVQSQGNSLLSRGSIRSESGDPAGALQDYLAAYRLFLGTGDARSRSITLQYLSQLYADARDFKRADLYLRQAVEAYSREPLLQLSYANAMANLLAEQGRYPAAEKEYRRSLAIAREAGAHSLELAVLSNLALGQIRQARLTAASRTVDEAVEVSRRTGIKLDNNLRATIARLAFAQGKTRLARQTMDQIYATTNGKPILLNADTEFAAYQIYKAAGDMGRAIAHLETSGRLRNDALALGNSTRASLMAARFDFATQDLRIAALKATVLQRDVTLERQAAARQRLIVAAVVVLLLAAMAALSIWLAALRRSRNQLRAFSARLEDSNTSLEAALLEVKQRAQAERHARQLAVHDALTGLPNRRFLSEDIQDGLGDGSDQNIVVLLLDLDRFKPINDIHGHEIGDQVLVTTARRLEVFCSRVDGNAVRLGGDEFVMVLSGSYTDETTKRLAYELIHAIGAPIYVGERRLTLGASIGIARFPQDGRTIEELLRAADIAMYEAKRSGKNTCRFFDPALKTRQRLRAV